MGKWKHGFFSFTAVGEFNFSVEIFSIAIFIDLVDKLKYIQIVYSGATNVGSVDVYIDKDLKTNQWNGFKIGKHNRTNEFNEIKLPATNLTKGELLGQFNMGSTVVLIFEAPKQFK